MPRAATAGRSRTSRSTGARFIAKPFTPTLAAVVIHELLAGDDQPAVPGYGTAMAERRI